MDHNQNQSMDLPAPQFEQQTTPSTPENQPVKRQGTEINPEFLPQINPAPQSVQQANSPVLPASPLPSTVSQIEPKQTAQQQAAHPQIADDLDLIEKEWVEKAKSIVAQTQTDPYQQNKALNKMKADYIKKRYNRDISVHEE